MHADLLAAMTGFAFVASITPGPNNMMLLASGANFGFRRTVPHMLGIGIGFMVMLLISGLGLGEVFRRVPGTFFAFKIACVLYMLWLAWKIATAGAITDDGASTGRPMTFLEGALFQWVNPKAWAMILTAIGAYTVPSDYLISLLVVTLVFGIINIPSISCWTMFGVALRRLLSDPVRVRYFNVAMALLLIGSLYPIVTGLE